VFGFSLFCYNLCYALPNPMRGLEVMKMANKKQSSSKLAKLASKVLRDGRYSKASKSLAGSVLSQTKKK